MISIHKAAHILNEALEHEPEVMSDLFRVRLPFESEALADHPTIQVGVTKSKELPYDLGFLGLLNGIFGTETDRLAVIVDDDFYDNPAKMIQKFEAYTNWNDRGETKA